VARALEHDTKAYLRSHGISVPLGISAKTPGDAAAAADELGGRVVVKALVSANRRWKAGAVRFAESSAEAGRHAGELLGSSVEGHTVAEVLVEERLEISSEAYLALLIDKQRQKPQVLASERGGVDVEETAFRSGEYSSRDLDPWGRVSGYELRDLWQDAGVSGPRLTALAEVSRRAAEAFFASDATQLELNPLAFVQDRPEPVAIGALLEIDDGAIARQPILGPLAQPVTGRWRSPTELERRALANAAAEAHRGTARFVELEGEIGLVCGGGGGSLVAFDAVRRAGGRPACYTEIGGNPSAEKVRELTRIVLSCPGVQGLLVAHNITNNTQVDLVATGVVAALSDLDVDPRTFPVVAREVGTHDAEGRSIFIEAGVQYLGEEHSIEDAARTIVGRVALAGAG
jgi:succinyl-CoA synthetase beta subunit/citryl-CoA synthetase large subunit